ncbi:MULTISPECIES: SHOCT domain-containing protein [Streptomycetaceae]|uniref:SHOCT domain-containing protein n=1 Tax=Streptantibioticus cattleyicolor (strain ATCC 35852 / DSM 46488 / JCM 4925 / NBRC 14057 / NRRL 8057) TaxID=1003195 RepID=F8K4E8_STREN|nr:MULTISPECIES: SHOCT domain-containing protein [Streptomycetaceae]AEW95103.1 hypothetical protein SCATT_27320 [Streptantibioticus cattleyicolor NRRL 8057 = DSM 46488]MYS59692.1 SHOCT domain-containing protein [Streptomyces sp. SID5468]CCB75449.1 conserved exported protein of unknown function [Streptantibioticus cattleyicolor NRRL 8057 = DSM 46488]
MGWMMTGMGIWTLLGGLLLVALLGLAVVAVAAVLRSRAPGGLPPGGRRGPEEAREILRRRYAAGEIDEDEFWRRMSGINAE